MRKNLEKLMLGMAIFCALIGVVLLLGVTLAKYTQLITGHTLFGVEKFNAAILPPTVTEGSSVVTTISAHDLRPGMIASFGDDKLQDTATHIPFRVANGTSAADATSVPLQYTVQIRTANSLPLTYTLAYTVTEENGQTTTYYYDAILPPREVQIEGAETQYEYTFSPIPRGSSQSASPEETEAKFLIPAGDKETPLRYNTHELIAEWPSTSTSEGVGNIASAEYMKEVEVIEILVKVVSLNPSDDPNYGQVTDPPSGVYSDGIVILTPPDAEDETQKSYTYEIDLRSFHMDKLTDTVYSFDLTVENGVGKSSVSHTYDRIRYTLELRIPVELLERQTNPYAFHVSRLNGDQVIPLITEDTETVYRIYDEKTGLPVGEDLTARPADDQIEEGCALYMIYLLDITEQGDTLSNTTSSIAGLVEPYYDAHTYRISTDLATETTDATAFLHKLEWSVTATFFHEGSASTPSTPSTPENTP